MRYSARSDIGKKYHHNEDYFVLPEPNEKQGITNVDIKQKGRLFVLCDGVGGAKSGQVASELTANLVLWQYYELSRISDTPLGTLSHIIIDVNAQVFQLAQRHTQYHGMCTTLVAILFLYNTVHINSVGDSRVYLFRDNTLTQLTEDQSEVWELYRTGAITKNEMRTYPRSNIIKMAISIEKNLRIDSINQYYRSVRENDLFLLCSDGLTDIVGDDEIANVLSTQESLDNITASLVDLANDHGGKDNVTVILIQV